jgi:hypothetical protein
MALGAALGLALAGCGPDSPEDRLRATIAAMEEAVEEKRPRAFVEHVSEDFRGEHGQLDRRSLRGMLASQLLGAERIEIVLGAPAITLHPGERATVKVSALVVGGRYLPEHGETLEIVSGWKLEDGEWRCYSAEWTRGGG